jgi:hypothetical protein
METQNQHPNHNNNNDNFYNSEFPWLDPFSPQDLWMTSGLFWYFCCGRLFSQTLKSKPQNSSKVVKVLQISANTRKYMKRVGLGGVGNEWK